MTRAFTSHIAIVAVFILWGTSGLFTRLIPASAQTFVFADALIGVVILALLLFFTGQYRELLNLKSLAVAIAVGFLMTITGVLFFQALLLTSITNTLLSHYTMPVFVILLAPLFLGERSNRSVLVALPVALAGLAIILPLEDLSLGNMDVVGIGFAVASAIFYALNIIWTRRLGSRLSPLPVAFGTYVASAVSLAPFVLSQPSGVQAMINYAPLFILKGVAISALPMVAYAWCLSEIEAQRVSIIGFLEPLSAIVLAAIFFAEIPSVRTLIGGLLILAAGYWVLRKSGETARIVAVEPPSY